MAQSIGTVTKREDGGFEGTLVMMTLNTKIAILPNEVKENDRQPDFRIYAAKGNEIWAAGTASGRTPASPMSRSPSPIRRLARNASLPFSGIRRNSRVSQRPPPRGRSRGGVVVTHEMKTVTS